MHFGTLFGTLLGTLSGTPFGTLFGTPFGTLLGTLLGTLFGTPSRRPQGTETADHAPCRIPHPVPLKPPAPQGPRHPPGGPDPAHCALAGRCRRLMSMHVMNVYFPGNPGLVFWLAAWLRESRDGRLAEVALTPPGADSPLACPPSHARDQKENGEGILTVSQREVAGQAGL
jgi:hypothetical protein